MDNRDVEEQLDRRSRASSPTYSSISSTAKSGSNNGNKQFVIIASNPSEPAEMFEDSRVNLARATNFAELSKLRESLGSNSAINIVYMQQEKDPMQGNNLLVYRSNSPKLVVKTRRQKKSFTR